MMTSFCECDWYEPKLYHAAVRKARREYTCVECDALIQPGER